MADRTDASSSPTARGPWPEVTSREQIFDHGAPWCINADGHPEYDYPDPELHVPLFECRTAGLAVEAVPDLAGQSCALAMYAARPFRFGEARGPSRSTSVRVVLEISDSTGESAARFSVATGDALRLVRHVQRVVDLIDQPQDR